MRVILSALFFISFTGFAFAPPAAVPEIDGFAGPAALGLVGALTALIWERRRKRTK